MEKTEKSQYTADTTKHRFLVPLYSPFSESLIPLSIGLRRRFMRQIGAVSHEVRLHNSTIHYFVAHGRASGPPLVLAHGIADNATTWATIFSMLRGIGDVYMPDLPGFGLSTPPAGIPCTSISTMSDLMVDFVREVVGRRTLLVGNSMGGWIGFQLACQHPELLRGLIAINPGGAPLQGHESWQPFIELASVRNLEAVRTIYRQMFARPPLRLPLYTGQRSFQQIFSHPAVQAILHETTEQDLLNPAHLRTIRVPVGLIWGLDDHFLPEGSLEFFREIFPHARWLLLPATGHLPQLESPFSVIRFIHRFNTDLPTRPPVLADWTRC